MEMSGAMVVVGLVMMAAMMGGMAVFAWRARRRGGRPSRS